MKLEEYLKYLLEEEEEVSEPEEDLESEESDDKPEIETDQDMTPDLGGDGESSEDGEEGEGGEDDDLDLGGNDDNEDPDEKITDKMKRHDEYKKFEMIKSSFDKLEDLILTYRYNDESLVDETNSLRWAFDNYTNFYGKMDNDERKKGMRDIIKDFKELVSKIKKN